MKETLKVIRERRTTRKFKAEQIKEEELQAIIEAGLYAPSAHNKQSWNFTVLQNAELIDELNIESKKAATENMLIAAEALGIGSCWNGFVSILFNSEKGAEYKTKLNIPEGNKPYYVVLLGYKDVISSNAPARKENSVQYIR